MSFIGRKDELNQLNQLYNSKRSQIVALYGRRRIGKSSLIEQFIKNKNYIKFEGLEGQTTPKQIAQFTHDLALQINDPLLLKVRFEKWEDIFDYLTQYFVKKSAKIIFFLDELQWLASNQTLLVSLIKKYWDQHWKNQQVMLVLCGSVSSYMVKKVINSSALYGRIDWSFSLNSLSAGESLLMLKSKRSRYEVFQYLLVLGGVPKYLEMINPNRSFAQNINSLIFLNGSPFNHEYEKIFYSQFKEHKNYELIVNHLSNKSLSLKQIAGLLKIKSGGGVKSYLDNLEKALFITQYTPFHKTSSSREKLYKLTDEYLRFYFKYVKPHKSLIEQNNNKDLFSRLTEKSWDVWLGFAFENFCLKNAMMIAEKCGFAEKVINFGPFFRKNDQKFQVDLIFERSDKTITLCELKYYNKPVSTKIIPEVEKKCQLIKIPHGYTLEKVLITQFEPEQSLLDADYFHHIVTVKDF